MLGSLVTLLVRLFLGILNFLPFRLAVSVTEILFRSVLFLRPSLTAVAEKNLKIAFPDFGAEERKTLLRESISAHSRLIVDSARLARYDKTWVSKHLEFENQAAFEALKKNHKTGVVVATGHLGSFELLAHGAALLGFPLAFVVRNFAIEALDQWWISIREAHGNIVLNRSGALKRAIRLIRDGTDVAFLFDQNVTRNLAVFPKFFSQPAAVTRAVAVTVLKTGAPLIVAGLVRTGEQNHKIVWKQCQTEDVIHNETLSHETKVEQITARASTLFEGFVKLSPAEWFWFHRRWKTRPTEADPSLYSEASPE
ncbi:MAG: lysophospholipid acyltransferase family protein [Bdellovibrionales bacterium]|nr:lysophospholipid acyltransferase family protein [Bdellovibrionales bacterium]